jgi:hypothetical protein
VPIEAAQQGLRDLEGARIAELLGEHGRRLSGRSR